MKIHKLSFADFNIHSSNILEVRVHTGIEMSLEMIEECSEFVEKHFQTNFAILVNKVNEYTYSYEAQLCLASYPHLKAIAFIHYSEQSAQTTKALQKLRSLDLPAIQTFSGDDIQQAMMWLNDELVELNVG